MGQIPGYLKFASASGVSAPLPPSPFPPSPFPPPPPSSSPSSLWQLSPPLWWHWEGQSCIPQSGFTLLYKISTVTSILIWGTHRTTAQNNLYLDNPVKACRIGEAFHQRTKLGVVENNRLEGSPAG
jgi:hypothetical protein